MQLRLAFALPVLLAAVLVMACAESDAADGPGTPTSGVATNTAETGSTDTPEARITPPAIVPPPDATAEAGGESVSMGTGSYCWGSTGPTMCIDKLGVITREDALVVQQGATVTVSNGLGSAIETATVSTFAATGQVSDVGNGELAWEPGPFDELPSTITADGVTFAAALEPGRYVVSVFLTAPQGDVAYGVILGVQ